MRFETVAPCPLAPVERRGARLSRGALPPLDLGIRVSKAHSFHVLAVNQAAFLGHPRLNRRPHPAIATLVRSAPRIVKGKMDIQVLAEANEEGKTTRARTK
jgi:hypothetical protein